MDNLHEKLYIFCKFNFVFWFLVIENFSFLQTKYNIKGDIIKMRSTEIIYVSSEVISIHTSWRLFSREYNSDASMSELICESISDKTIRKERLPFL